MELVVNADDLGISPTVNAAIVRAFELGIIDRATAIANSPFFADACRLVHANGIENRIGIHFNITEGMPMSPQMAQTPLFCSNDGRLRFRRNTRIFLSRSQMRAVAAECEEQISTFHRQGLRPNHLDSHHHVHTEWHIFRAIEPVLRRHGFLSVRLSKDIGSSSLSKRVYKTLFNGYLRKRTWASTQSFCDYTDLIRQGRLSSMRHIVVEVMCHPDLLPGDLLIDAISREELAPRLKELRRMLCCSEGL